MDLFKIGSNIASMQALNSLYKLNSKLSVHQERLSTGKRVNSARDDSSAYTIAKSIETSNMRRKRDSKSMENALSVLSIVDAGQQKQIEILQNIKSKVIHAADTTLNTQQRQSILDSINGLRAEIDSVANSLKFNGESLVNPSTSTHKSPIFNFNGWGYDQFYVSASVVYSTGDNFGVNGVDTPGSNNLVMATTSATPSSIDIEKVDWHIRQVIIFNTLTNRAINYIEGKKKLEDTLIQKNKAIQSTYEDADFAKEQMELMKVQILQQTATAALAQANSAPQSVLSLFR